MAKRFIKTAINWAEFEKRYPQEQHAQFMSFKSKYELYMRKMQAYAPEAPKIDWEHYQEEVPIPGLVDKLKTGYEAFKVPYPQDTVSAQIDEQWKTLEPEVKAYCANVQKDIEAANKEIARIKALPKFDQMTMDMFYDLYPESAVDSVKKPTFWPHTPEEQEGYKSEEANTEH